MSSAPSHPTWTVTDAYVDIACALGEGPAYEPATHTLRWVDIKAQRLHTIDLAKGPASLVSLQLDTPVSVTFDIAGVDPADRLLVGAKTGVAVLNRRSGKYRYVARYEDARWEGIGGDGQETDEKDQEGAQRAEVNSSLQTTYDAVDKQRLRSNDATVDPAGRIWIGTMTDFPSFPLREEGTLYRLDRDLSLHATYHPISIPNSIGFPAPAVLLFTNSLRRQLQTFSYAAASGRLAAAAPLYTHAAAGEPDGFTLDADGCVWQAIWGEGRVLRLDARGAVVGEVRLPTRCVTCALLVGGDLFVTSAQEPEPETYPDSVRFGGALFRVNVGVSSARGHGGRGGAEAFKFEGDVKLLDV